MTNKQKEKWVDWPVDENGDHHHHQVLIFATIYIPPKKILSFALRYVNENERTARNIILIVRTADTYLNHHHHHPYPPLFHNFFRMFSETTQKEQPMQWNLSKKEKQKGNTRKGNQFFYDSATKRATSTY